MNPNNFEIDTSTVAIAQPKGAGLIVTLNLNYVDSASFKRNPSRVSPKGAKAALAAAKRRPMAAARQSDDLGK
jgi:hypothetical protein